MKLKSLILSGIMTIFTVSCFNSSSSEIIVISREQGSGTRSAFTEITKIADSKTDNTYSEAIVQNSTNAVMTNVANDVNSIGYISLGSLNDTVKAVKVDGAKADFKNIKEGK